MEAAPDRRCHLRLDRRRLLRRRAWDGDGRGLPRRRHHRRDGGPPPPAAPHRPPPLPPIVPPPPSDLREHLLVVVEEPLEDGAAIERIAAASVPLHPADPE